MKPQEIQPNFPESTTIHTPKFEKRLNCDLLIHDILGRLANGFGCLAPLIWVDIAVILQNSSIKIQITKWNLQPSSEKCSDYPQDHNHHHIDEFKRPKLVNHKTQNAIARIHVHQNLTEAYSSGLRYFYSFASSGCPMQITPLFGFRWMTGAKRSYIFGNLVGSSAGTSEVSCYHGRPMLGTSNTI